MARTLLKIAALLLVLIFSGAAFLALTLPKQAQEMVREHIAGYGFTSPRVPKPALSAAGFSFPPIALDAEGFSTLEGLVIHLNWPSYIFKKDIESIHISKIIHTALSTEKPFHELQKRFKPSQIQSLPVGKFSVDLYQLNLGTDWGDVRIEAKALFTLLDDGAITVQSVAWARQYQLGFQIPVSGLIRADGSFLFESTFNDGKMNLGALRVGRLNGWLRMEGQGDTITRFSTQVDSGSAKIFSLPLQDLSLSAERMDEKVSAVFRSGVTGFPTLILTGNYDGAPSSPPSATLNFEIGSGGELSALLSSLFPDGKRPSLDGLTTPGLATLHYLPERRFAQGPIPFSLTGTGTGAQAPSPFLAGHVLLYPDSLAVRGSVEGHAPLLDELASLLSIPPEFYSPGSLRMDFSLKPFFTPDAQRQ